GPRLHDLALFVVAETVHQEMAGSKPPSPEAGTTPGPAPPGPRGVGAAHPAPERGLWTFGKKCAPPRRIRAGPTLRDQDLLTDAAGIRSCGQLTGFGAVMSLRSLVLRQAPTFRRRSVNHGPNHELRRNCPHDLDLGFASSVD